YFPQIINGVGRIVRIEAPDKQFGRCLCISAKKDFGPRMGLAYRPGGSTRTVIRAGYGVFYDYVPCNTKQTLAVNAPQIDRQTVTNTVPTPPCALNSDLMPSSISD